MSKNKLQQVLLGEEIEIGEVQEVDSDHEVSREFCVECGDQPFSLVCENCDEQFCQVCFQYLHRSGKRRHHKTRSTGLQSLPKTHDLGDVTLANEDSEMETQEIQDEETQETQIQDEQTLEAFQQQIKGHVAYIPMRLTHEERRYLRLLEAALNVSEYTDKIDILGSGSKLKRIVQQLKEMCTIITGLVVANNFKEGQALVKDNEFKNHQGFFQKIFEIGRRYKIMNPEKMRNTFGKLMYMIMDSRNPLVKENLEFDLYKPVLTVQSVFEQGNSLDILDETDFYFATQEIRGDDKSRREIAYEIRVKEQAIERLAAKYASKLGSRELVRQALYSVGDYFSYLGSNRTPVQVLSQLLTDNFSKTTIEPGYELSIHYGSGGARLSHSHGKQYQYVLQSLTLWSQIMLNMFKLWKLADEDLLSDKHRYHLADTGQGLNRVMPCPGVQRAMYAIISHTQQQTGAWVGSSAVHLGDTAVPNALFFLDKYLQVPRILNPLNNAIVQLPRVYRDKHARAWIDAQFGGLDSLEKRVLCDFFKHAFDGSGADNFYDAGSCIDGRLTSAWNWANSISRKPYYKHFLVAGFSGFDGSEGF